MISILVVIGTRPEAIKMAPIINQINKTDGLTAIVCLTAQQREMVDQALSVFDIIPDFDLDIMSTNQTLCSTSARVISGIEEVILDVEPDVVLVQGDTTTAFCGALAGFYTKTKVGHVEAGLRTGDRFSPYPEEVNRSLISRIADFHFAPTESSAKNLIRERISEDEILVSGNTVIDSLLLTRQLTRAKSFTPTSSLEDIDQSKKVVLVTGHRRENIGEPVREICKAIKYLANHRDDVQLVYPVHLNPNIQKPVSDELSGVANVLLIDPLGYQDFVWLLDQCEIVMTDSGGIQEEAPSFGKPVLVMRETTERPEGIESGNAMLVGHDSSVIVSAVEQLLDSPVEYKSMTEKANPYGNGDSSKKIVEFIIAKLQTELKTNQLLATA